MERTQAVEFIIRLEQTYLEQRDMKALLAAMAPGVTWIGSGRGEVCCGKQEARRLLEHDLAEYGGAFSITERWQEAEPLPGEKSAQELPPAGDKLHGATGVPPDLPRRPPALGAGSVPTDAQPRRRAGVQYHADGHHRA